MKARAFHSMTIKGQKFTAHMSSDGPYIDNGVHGVAIGSCTSVRKMAGGWCVVKYGNEVRLDLVGFSESDVKLFCSEFGIPVYENVLESNVYSQEFFFSSKAWIGLKDWASNHKSVVKKFATCQSYLPWHARLKVDLAPAL